MTLHPYFDTLQTFPDWLKNSGYPSFIHNQILQWIFAKGIIDFQQMTNLSKDLRETLSQQFLLPSLQLVKMVDSDDGETTKFLWKLRDGTFIESVLIYSGDRRTVCVSSQVGCPARCAFCASGKEGLFRHLTCGEIIEQVLLIDLYLRPKNEKVSHIVFMGMGEPLDNYDQVTAAIVHLNDPKKFNISQRRITVSTVGIVENIYKLANFGLKINLVLSLHAPNQHIRKKIIPYARRYELADILKAMDYFAEKTKRDITFEYTLLKGINDQIEHAQELVELVSTKQCTVNLIPYNTVVGLKLQRPDHETIWAFREVLDKARIVNTCRYTKGDDIAAACGQLALITN